MYMLLIIYNVFTFDQLNASKLNKSIHVFQQQKSNK